MGRYFERAESHCRLLRLQTEALVDRPVREIHYGWSRIYQSVGRMPPGDSLEQHGSDDDYTLADSFTLADDMTFEPLNPDSVRNCFSQGRENARQMRHCISAEMWTSLNLTYLWLRDLTIQDIWRPSPETFYAETTSRIDNFIGVAEATMYRDVGWSFMQLGRYIERSQMTSSLLIAQLSADQSHDSEPEADWTTLLRSYHAVEAYNRRYGVEVRPGQALDLLATDPLLPGSLHRSLNIAESELAVIGHGPNAVSSGALRRLAGRLGALMNYDWPDEEDRQALLRRVNGLCRELHDRVTATYFDYPIEDSPGH